MFILMAVPVSADADVNNLEDDEYITNLDEISIDFNKDNWDNCYYKVICRVGHSIIEKQGETYSVSGTTKPIVGDIDIHTFTENDSYTFSVNDDYFIPNTMLPVQIISYRYNSSTDEYIEGSETLEESFGVEHYTNIEDTSAPDWDNSMRYFFTDCSPETYSKTASTIFMDNGLSADVGCMEIHHGSLYIEFHETDISIFISEYEGEEEKVIAYSLSTVDEPYNTDSLFIGDTEWEYGIGFNELEFGIDTTDNFNISFNIYMGVDTYNNYTVFHTDSTIASTDFSVQTIPPTNINYGISGGHGTYDNEFKGVNVYIPGSEYPISSFGEVSGWEGGTIKDVINEYGELIGIPFFYIFIVFLIIGICSIVPYAFAVRWGFEINNYVYAGGVILGVSINWGLGLIDTWLFAFFVLFCMFATMYRFREYLGLQTATAPTALENIKEKIGLSLSQRKYKTSPKKDKGIKIIDGDKKKHFKDEGTYVHQYYRGGGEGKRIMRSKKTGKKIAEFIKGRWTS